MFGQMRISLNYPEHLDNLISKSRYLKRYSALKAKQYFSFSHLIVYPVPLYIVYPVLLFSSWCDLLSLASRVINVPIWFNLVASSLVFPSANMAVSYTKVTVVLFSHHMYSRYRTGRSHFLVENKHFLD